MIRKVLGQKFTIGVSKKAPNNQWVSSYLDAAKKGEGKAQKILERYKKKTKAAANKK